MIYQTCEILPDLQDFIFGYRIADFLPAFQAFTGLIYLIRSCNLCIISTAVSKIYRAYGLYKVWGPLDNVDQPFEHLTDLWTF